MNKKRKLPDHAKFHAIKLAAVAFMFAVAGQFLLRYSLAATGPTLFVAPASSTVLQYSTFNVEVRLDSAGQDVDGVEAYLTYPASALEFQSISEGGTAFGIGLPSSGGGGTVTIRRVVNPDQSSTVKGANLLVATISFKALAGSGTAAVNYTAQSRVTAPSAGTASVLAGTTGGVYTITSPPPPPPPTSPVSPTTPVTSPPPAPTSSQPAPARVAPTSSTRPPSTSLSAPSPAVEAPSPTSATPAPIAPAAPQTQAISTKTPKLRSAEGNLITVAKIAGAGLLVGSLVLLAKIFLGMQYALHAPHVVQASGGPLPSVFIGGSTPSPTTMFPKIDPSGSGPQDIYKNLKK